MIVIEGAGRLGKTTAAKKIVEIANNRYGIPAIYEHMGRPDDRFDFWSDYSKMMNINLVRDRFHLGGAVWHGEEETGLIPRRLQILNSTIRAMGGLVVVFCHTSDEGYAKLWENTNRGEDEMFSLKKHVEANRLYRGRLAPPYADQVWALTDMLGYPDYRFLNRIVDEWQRRRDLVRRLQG